MRARAASLRFRDSRHERIYFHYQAFREHAERDGGLTAAKAKSGAKKMMAHKFNLDVRQIRNIVKEGDRLRAALHAKTEASGAKLKSQHRASRRMVRMIERAVAVLRDPYYENLLRRCAMHPLTKLPVAMAAFYESDTSPRSIQQLTAVLAHAFLRAHKDLNREVPGYTQRKRKRK